MSNGLSDKDKKFFIEAVCKHPSETAIAALLAERDGRESPIEAFELSNGETVNVSDEKRVYEMAQNICKMLDHGEYVGPKTIWAK